MATCSKPASVRSVFGAINHATTANFWLGKQVLSLSAMAEALA